VQKGRGDQVSDELRVLQAMVESGVMTTDEIVDWFRDELREELVDAEKSR
jgi:hypothetical protein